MLFNELFTHSRTCGGSVALVLALDSFSVFVLLSVSSSQYFRVIVASIINGIITVVNTEYHDPRDFTWGRIGRSVHLENYVEFPKYFLRVSLRDSYRKMEAEEAPNAWGLSRLVDT